MKTREQLESMTEHELLVELVRQQDETARRGKIFVALMAVVAAVALISALILIPNMSRTQAEAEQLILSAKTSLEEVDVMVKNIEDLSVNVNTLVTDNADALTDSMEKIKNIDFNSLNRSIKNLSGILEPLAEFFNLF